MAIFRVLAAVGLFLSPVIAAAGSDGVCILYSQDTTRSYLFSGVTAKGALNPQLLNFPNWDGVLLGLDSGEDEDTMYIVPIGIGSNPNMTIATIQTVPSGTANVSYAVLGSVPGFENIAPYTYMPTLHLDTKRSQMIATLVGTDGQPPAIAGPIASSDPGDLFLVIADIFPSNGTVSRVLLDLSEQDLRWGSAVLSGVSAFDGEMYWLNPEYGNVPSGQALYGFPLNGSAPTVVPFGTTPNLAHIFYSTAQKGLLTVMESVDGSEKPFLARFSPPSPTFTPIFSWNLTANEEDWGLYDVSKDGTKLLSVIIDSKSGTPSLVIVDLVNLKEIQRIPIHGWNQNINTMCDVNFCNING
jgi:hypothetical protein